MLVGQLVGERNSHANTTHAKVADVRWCYCDDEDECGEALCEERIAPPIVYSPPLCATVCCYAPLIYPSSQKLLLLPSSQSSTHHLHISLLCRAPPPPPRPSPPITSKKWSIHPNRPSHHNSITICSPLLQLSPGLLALGYGMVCASANQALNTSITQFRLRSFSGAFNTAME